VGDAMTIDTSDLRKSYGATEALRGLTLQVPAGAVCGFLGRNGAGKTTAIKVLLGMVRPTDGRAHVFGLDATAPASSVEIRRRTAFVAEDKNLYHFMTVGEMIRFTAAFYPRWRSDLEARYTRSFALPLDRKVKSLSRGMRTKTAVLIALCRGAELLVLDEPTSGLDPAAAEEVLQALLSRAGSSEATVFFSSHQIAEVDQIADHVVIIDKGRGVVTGDLEQMRERYRRIQLVFEAAAPDVRFRARGVVSVKRDRRVLTVLSSEGSNGVLEEARGLGPSSIDVAPVTLKEIFLETVSGEN
jgi:ABC-2 type transport system ATP-binding protein